MKKDAIYKKPDRYDKSRVLLFIASFVILAAVLICNAEACSVTEVTLWVKRLPGDAWGREATICKGETAYFKAVCQVDEDTKKRPIKWKISYGDGTTDTLWTYNSNSGPETGGSYSVEFEHTYTENNDNEDKFYQVTVEAQRINPITGSAIADWETSGVKVIVLKIYTIMYQKGTEWIDRDLCIMKGTSVTFKAIPMPFGTTWPPNKPEWTISGVDAGTGETMSYTFDEVNLEGYLVKAVCCNTEYYRSVTVQEVMFIEDTSQKYGFDDWSTPSKPYKSLKKHETDTDKAKAEIVTDPVDDVHFKSVIPGKVTIIPTQASTTPQPLTFNSNELPPSGSPEWVIQAYKNTGGGVPTPLAEMAIKVYKEPIEPYKIKVIAVWEDNDDEQVIDPGEGPEPGGSPLCIKYGDNGFRDTVPVPDDYAIDVGPLQGIYVGVNGICNTTANDQDIPCIPHFTSGLEAYLNDTIFNQCVTSFTVSSGTIRQVNYDLDRNGKLNYMSEEEHDLIIRDAKDESYDYNVFVVFDIDTGVGFGDSPGHYTWVEYNVTHRTMAHELGHNVGDLRDQTDSGDTDSENLMYYGYGTRLRAYQWDKCNPRQDPGDY